MLNYLENNQIGEVNLEEDKEYIFVATFAELKVNADKIGIKNKTIELWEKGIMNNFIILQKRLRKMLMD